MPKNNLLILVLVAVVSLLCHQRVQGNRYGRVLVDAMEQVEQRYIEPVPPKTLFEGAMEGMIDRLGDPYSAYVAPKALEELNEEIESEFGGVGMEVTLDSETNQLTVTTPLVGTPAHEKGILPGDRILRIDGRSTQGLSLEDAVAMMRGKPGESVTLTILHEGAEQPVDIELVRDRIKVDTVLGDRRESDGRWNFLLEGAEGIGYVRINKFSKETPAELRAALEWLGNHRMRGLVLDLRDNPGGLLHAAVEVCDLFIDSGVIVTTRGRDAEVREYYEARSDGTFQGFPMAVLVNSLSASASEIVAACLQDHHRAVVVGQRTWGKGTVQEVIDLMDQSGALRLTTATYWRPSGRNIHRMVRGEGASEARDDETWGVTPDEGYRVVVEGDALRQLRLYRQRRDIYRPDNGGKPAATGPSRPAPGGTEAPAPPFAAAKGPLEVDPQLAKAVAYLREAIQGD